MSADEEPRDIFDEIRAGMAAVTAEDLAQAPPEAAPRGPDEPSLGEADEYLKRFFWYIMAKGREIEPLIAEGRRLGSEVPHAFTVVSPYGTVELVSPNPDDEPKLARMAELHKAIEAPTQFVGSLWVLFFAEARRRNPLLRDCARPVVCADWTFSDADYEGQAAEKDAMKPAFFFDGLAESQTPQ